MTGKQQVRGPLLGCQAVAFGQDLALTSWEPSLAAAGPGAPWEAAGEGSAEVSMVLCPF